VERVAAEQRLLVVVLLVAVHLAVGCYNPPSIPAPNLRIQIDTSFSSNAYLMCILEKLELTKFINDLALFDGTVRNGRNVILKVGYVPKRPGYSAVANAETNNDLGPYKIQIIINEDRVNLSSLQLATIILHEIIHAELFVANFHKGGSPIDADFEYNFNQYVEKYSEGGNSNIQHNYMAEKMVSKMASILSAIHPYLGKTEFQNNPNVKAVFTSRFITAKFYTALAWAGLHWTDKWRYDLPERNTYQEYQSLASENLNNECQ